MANLTHAVGAGEDAGGAPRRSRARCDRDRAVPRPEPGIRKGSDKVIGHLSGVVRRAGPDFVVLDVGGVGYIVTVASQTRQQLPPPGGDVELHIHTHVREDQLNLYGFASVEELELFEMLIQVDGVGPKVGLNILSAASLEVLKRAIMSEDAAPIRRASGVGQRTAAKVIIELKPRLDAVAALEAVPRAAAMTGDGAVPKAVETALRNLGFSSQEARTGLESVDWKSAPSTQEALASALKALGRK
ncbi:MAG: Holliday junction branch migration protein RuvA [Chloroflexi bacterium]|nr:MAG: Holliday junction branch migration protein RuvA [Chloroflexota bacterium]